MIKLFLDFFNFQAIVDKTNVMLLQSPLSPHSVLISERLTQRETEFSTKEPTVATLRNWGKSGHWKYKSRFFCVTLGFVQDCRRLRLCVFFYVRYLF